MNVAEEASSISPAEEAALADFPEKQTSVSPQKLTTAFQAIKKRANLHNTIYAIIVILSFLVFAGEVYVAVKVLGGGGGSSGGGGGGSSGGNGGAHAGAAEGSEGSSGGGGGGGGGHNVPVWLTVSLVTASGVLFLLAFLDRYLAWRHHSKVTKETEQKVWEACAKRTEGIIETLTEKKQQ